MDFTLNTEHFSLSLSLDVFENDIQYPSNTIMNVSVRSGGFAGCASMDIDIKEFAKFALDTCDIYEKLTGKTEIREPYGRHMYLSLSGDGKGHICIKGMLNHDSQTLAFENRIDQTCFRTFACELKKSCKKYLK